MPLYTPLPQPWAVGDLADLTQDQANNRTANNCYFSPIVLYSTVTINSMRTQIGTAGNGHIQMGIYDANGNLLASTASAATVTGIMTLNLTSSLTIGPGRYYLALWIDNATDTTFSANGTTPGAWPALNGVNVGGLPALMSTINPVNFHRRLALLGLITGGWS